MKNLKINEIENVSGGGKTCYCGASGSQLSFKEKDTDSKRQCEKWCCDEIMADKWMWGGMGRWDHDNLSKPNNLYSGAAYGNC